MPGCSCRPFRGWEYFVPIDEKTASGHRERFAGEITGLIADLGGVAIKVSAATVFASRGDDQATRRAVAYLAENAYARPREVARTVSRTMNLLRAQTVGTSGERRAAMSRWWRGGAEGGPLPLTTTVAVLREVAADLGEVRSRYSMLLERSSGLADNAAEVTRCLSEAQDHALCAAAERARFAELVDALAGELSTAAAVAGVDDVAAGGLAWLDPSRGSALDTASSREIWERYERDTVPDRLTRDAARHLVPATHGGTTVRMPSTAWRTPVPPDERGPTGRTPWTTWLGPRPYVERSRCERRRS